MSGVRCVVWDEWCEMASVWNEWREMKEMSGVWWREMSGEGWVVRDEWWEMSGERWVVGDECVCDVLYEMSEMSSVRCLCMWYVVWEMNEMSGVRWWWEMSDARWVDWDERCEVSGVRTATPNDVYTQQGAKPACQEDTNAKFSHLLLAQLPRTQFTHSKLPNPHASKTPTQNFRTSYWHSYPEHSLHTARRQTRMPGRHHRKCFTPPIGTATPNRVYTKEGAKPAFDLTLSRGSEYCACYTERSRGPAATRRATTLSRGSEYCACHTDRSRGPAATRRAATLSRGSEQTGAAGQRRPGAPQPFLDALSTAPATQTGAAGQRRPRAPQPFLERRPGAPQPFLEALSTAGPHREKPRASGDKARRNPF